MGRLFPDLPASGDPDFEIEAYTAFQQMRDSMENLFAEIYEAREGAADLDTNLSSIVGDGILTKVNAADTTADYLINKFEIGDNIDIQINDPGNYEAVEIIFDPTATTYPSSGIVLPPILSGQPYLIESDSTNIKIANFSEYTSGETFTFSASSELTLLKITDDEYEVTAPSTNEQINTSVTVTAERSGYVTSYAVHNIVVFPIAGVADDNIVFTSTESDLPYFYNVELDILQNYAKAYSYQAFMFSDYENQAETEEAWNDAAVSVTIKNKKAFEVNPASTKTNILLTTNEVRLKENDKIFLNHKSTTTCNVVTISNITELDTAYNDSLVLSNYIGNEVSFTLSIDSWVSGDIGKRIHHKYQGIARILYIDIYDSKKCYCDIEESFYDSLSIPSGDWFMSPYAYTITGLSPSLDSIPTLGFPTNNKMYIDSKLDQGAINYKEHNLTYVSNTALDEISVGFYNSFFESNGVKDIFNRNTYVIAYVDDEKILINCTGGSATSGETGLTITDIGSSSTGGIYEATFSGSIGSDNIGRFIRAKGSILTSGVAEIINTPISGDATKAHVYIHEAFSQQLAISSNDYELFHYKFYCVAQTTAPEGVSLAASRYDLNLLGETQTTTLITGYLHFDNLLSTGDSVDILVNGIEKQVTTTGVVTESKLAYDVHTLFLLRSINVIAGENMSDYSSYSHTITNWLVSNKVIHSAADKRFGDASLYFDGGGYLTSTSTGNEYNFGSKDFTIDFWFKPIDLLSGARTYKTLLNIKTSLDEYFYIGHTSEVGAVNEIVICYSNNDSAGEYFLKEISCLNEECWMHFALVRENDLLKLYLNGDLTETMDGVNIGFVEQPTLEIGKALTIANGTISSSRYYGYIDEFRISDIARWSTKFLPENNFYAFYKYLISIPAQSSAPTKCSVSLYNSTNVEALTGVIETIDEEYGFQALTYTGTGSALQVSGLNFKPNLIMIKNLTDIDNIYVFDNVRGYDRYWRTASATAQTVEGSESIVHTGSSLIIQNTTAGINTAGKDYLIWCWKADNSSYNGSEIHNYNSNLGIEIVQYTGDLGGLKSIDHNLGLVPKFIMIKNLDTIDRGVFYFAKNHLEPLSNNKYFPTETTPTIYVFNAAGCRCNSEQLFLDGTVNVNTENYIMYLFAEVPDFSSFGNIIGNGTQDGPFIDCGFSPEMVMYPHKGKAFDVNNSPNAIDLDLGTVVTQAHTINNSGMKIIHSTLENVSQTFVNTMSFAEKRPKNYNLTITSNKKFLEDNSKVVAGGVTLRKNETANNFQLLVNTIS